MSIAMAREDQVPAAKANIAMSPQPDLLTNTQTIWFQQEEDRFAQQDPHLQMARNIFTC
jgi:hypothetical protein